MLLYISVSANKYSMGSVVMHMFGILVFPYNNKQYTSKHVGTEIVQSFYYAPATNKTVMCLISRIEKQK